MIQKFDGSWPLFLSKSKGLIIILGEGEGRVDAEGDYLGFENYYLKKKLSMVNLHKCPTYVSTTHPPTPVTPY